MQRHLILHIISNSFAVYSLWTTWQVWRTGFIFCSSFDRGQTFSAAMSNTVHFSCNSPLLAELAPCRKLPLPHASSSDATAGYGKDRYCWTKEVSKLKSWIGVVWKCYNYQAAENIFLFLKGIHVITSMWRWISTQRAQGRMHTFLHPLKVSMNYPFIVPKYSVQAESHFTI